MTLIDRASSAHRVGAANRAGMGVRRRAAFGLTACLGVVVVLLVSLVVVGLLTGVAVAQPSEQPFEIVPGSFHITPSVTQAGAHEDLTTQFDFAHEESGPDAGATHNDVKTTVVELPPGFVGNNTAVPGCTPAQLVAETAHYRSACPAASQVGTISFVFTLPGTGAKPTYSTFPLYNMQVTSFGVTAELGFKAVALTQILPITVRPGDSGLTITSPAISEISEPHDISVTVWGIPASPVHDPERDLICLEQQTPGVRTCSGGGVSAGILAKPFLSNPTSCGSFTARLRSDSWEEPQNWSEESTQIAAIGECERVHFNPSLETSLTTHAAESSTGLDATLLFPQTWENPEGTSTANLRDAVVTLPEGVTVNPSAGAGLGSCTEAQLAEMTSSSPPGVGCPPESKIGTIEVETPVLAEKAEPDNSAVYIATPFENPFHSLLALYVVVRIPDRGIIVKVAGKITLDPVTGRLTTTFDENPQVPFNRFTLKFRPGATAPLVSPPACGTYTATGSLTPWSAPLEEHDLTSPPFDITQGVREGACPSSGTPPFAPQAITGTQNNAAGSYSPFYLRLTREDGEQEITGFSTIMPPGMTGNLTGIPFCPDASIEAARARNGEHGGQQELQAPSCPAASKIGHTIVEAGVGSVLAQNPGSLYLAGPYHDAPLSLVAITSAVVGPFDLGTVVIRFALRINPTTAQVEVNATGSDPIPHIIKGIITHVRNIRAYVDRPNFIINPTNCTRTNIENTITSAGADPTNPTDQQTVNITSPFQAADCASLAFKPSFKVTTNAKTSKANGASLNVNLTMPGPLGAQTNIHQVKVELPVQLPSRLTTLQKACTKAQFDTNPAGCPAASVVGHAKAITPILPVPLEGPAYFVSNGGEAFPNLILVLQGYGITIDLVGDTFISKHGITSSTFKTIPDQPVTSFELALPQGPFSALTANGNLCALTKTVTVKKKVTVRTKGRKRIVTRRVKQTVPATLTMPTEFVAQNGMVLHQTTTVAVTGCPKAKPAKKKTKTKQKHG